MNQPYRAELLGELRLTVNGRTIERFRTRKTAALLAFLALNVGRRHSRDFLAELIWPEREHNAGRHSLSMALSSLRGQIEGELGASDSVLLHADRTSVAFLGEGVETDVDEFEASLRHADAAEDEADAITHLAAAADLYRGELLRGFYEEWVFPEQQRLHEKHLTALDGLVVRLERAQDYHGALQYALRAVRDDPLRESAHRDAIRMFIALGQRDMANRQYAEMEKRIRRDMRAEPSAETRALLDSEPVPRPMAPSGRTARSARIEPPGGAVPLASRFYVARAEDAEFAAALERRDSIVLLKGARQVGKTSLLARGLQQARAAGSNVVFSHLQTLGKSQLSSADALFLELANGLREQLELAVAPSDTWDPRRSPGPNFRRYLRTHVLPELRAHLVWPLDEVDRLLLCEQADDAFALFRSWHDERALDPDGPWAGLTLAMAYSTEAHLLIGDAHQSPFNVGTRIALEDFTVDELADLNARHGGPLKDASELARCRALVGGQPYLVRLALFEMASRGASLDKLVAAAADEQWVFGDHLRRIGAMVARDGALVQAVSDVLAGRPCDRLAFQRLRSAGILTGGSPSQAAMRCGLYERYLAQQAP